jgi:riboflavin kinase/FMN adenylyltransferase
MVVRPASAPKLLTDLDQRLELLADTGVDTTVVVPFDRARAAEDAEDFVTEILVGCLRAQAVVVGEDFHFGRGRRGNVALLRAMGTVHGFDVFGLELVDADGRPTDGPKVSSTSIRSFLNEGDVRAAAALLGRSHEVRGVVQNGDRRGRELGFPTANVAIPGEICLPSDGIYAGWFLRADGVRWPTAISLGRRPTFYEAAEQSLLEAHVLDFSGDLYGETVAVVFVERLRGEVRFASVDALVAQMQQDVSETRKTLGV